MAETTLKMTTPTGTPTTVPAPNSRVVCQST